MITLKKNGFASMYMVYSFFIIFILMMLTTLAVNTYKQRFLNTLKNDIKEEIQSYQLDVPTSIDNT